MNKKTDKSNFRQAIIDFPNQFEEGILLAKNIKLEGKFKNVTVSGMGGSALPADLLRIYCHDLLKNNPNYKFFEITVNRYYSIPYESTLVKNLNIIASYSGNTEETISSLEELRKMNMDFIGLATGGKVEELSKTYRMPFVKLPVPNPFFQPRMGTGYFFGAMIQILINHGFIPNVSDNIVLEAKKLKINMRKRKNEGKKIANLIKGKVPIIYSSPKYKSVAMIWKIKINENSKSPAFWNFLPEADHNEMVGFTNPQGKFFIIMLEDSEDDPRNLRRFKATAKIISKSGVDSYLVNMEGNTVFGKIFESISLADWTSYYLALEYNQDPTPVRLVEKLKKTLAR